MLSTKERTQGFYKKYRVQCIGIGLVVICCIGILITAVVGAWQDGIKSTQYEPYLQSSNGSVLKDGVIFTYPYVVQCEKTILLSDKMINSVSSILDKDEYAKVLSDMNIVYPEAKSLNGMVTKENIVVPQKAFLSTYDGRQVYSWRTIYEKNSGDKESEYNIAVVVGNDLIKATLKDKKVGAEVSVFKKEKSN